MLRDDQNWHKQRSQYKAAVAALADPLRTRLVLVARAQSATLREVARTHAELAAIGLSQQYLVINGVLPAGQAEQDELSPQERQRREEVNINVHRAPEKDLEPGGYI